MSDPTGQTTLTAWINSCRKRRSRPRQAAGAMSCAAAVDRVQAQLRAKRAGHGGTLDPIATGVLRDLPRRGDEGRALPARRRQGVSRGGPARHKYRHARSHRHRHRGARRERGHARADRSARSPRRRGEQDQVPPMYSAIKQSTACDLQARAPRRRGRARAARGSAIDRIELVALRGHARHARDRVLRKGTYVRSAGRRPRPRPRLRRAPRGAAPHAQRPVLDRRRPSSSPRSTRPACVPIEDVLRLPAVTVTDRTSSVRALGPPAPARPAADHPGNPAIPAR